MMPTFFENYFANYTGKTLLKPEFYFAIYDKYFAPFRNKQSTFLEIGVLFGGSLDMWRAYLGEEASIFGIDINPDTKQFEQLGTTIFIGDQSNAQFLRTVIDATPPLDIVIDDGSHIFKHQIASFLMLFRHLQNGGVYLVEDVHTSYYPAYGGGYGVIDTFQQFAFHLTHLINMINIHSAKGCRSTLQMTSNLLRIFGLKPEDGEYLFKNLYTIHFYDSIIVFEKQENCRSLEKNMVENQRIQGAK